MAGHAAGISDDGLGFLHGRYPVGSRHGRDQDFSIFEFFNLGRIEDDMGFACGMARAGRKAFYNGNSVFRHSCTDTAFCTGWFLFFILLGPYGFRTGLEEPDLISPFIDAPFHIHIASVMFFNGFGITGQFFDLFVRNSRLFLLIFRYGLFFHIACILADQFDRFRIDHLGNDGQVVFAYAEIIGRNRTLYDVFAQAPGSFDGDGRIIAGHQIDGEHDAGRLGEYHHLYGSTQGDGKVVKSLFRTIVSSTVRKGRSIAFFNFLDDHIGTLYVEVGILLAGKAGIGQIFCRSAGTDGYEGIGFAHFAAQFFIAAADGIGQVLRHIGIADGFADRSSDIAELYRIFYVRQAFEQFLNRHVQTRSMHEMTVSFCRRRKSIGYGDLGLGSQFAQRRRLAADQCHIGTAQFIKP